MDQTLIVAFGCVVALIRQPILCLVRSVQFGDRRGNGERKTEQHLSLGVEEVQSAVCFLHGQRRLCA